MSRVLVKLLLKTIEKNRGGLKQHVYTTMHKAFLVMVCTPTENIEPHEYERAVRMAGFKVATTLGELGRTVDPDEVEVFETPTIKDGMQQFFDLPRVGYVQMLQSQGLLHDTYVYGVDAKQILPTALYPTETMDG